MRVKIKPFRDCNAKLILKSLESLSPLIPALQGPRMGIRKAVSQLKAKVMGIIDEEDAGEIAEHIEILEAEAEQAVVYGVMVIGHATAPLGDLVEYRAFSDVALPLKKSNPKKKVYFSTAITEAVIRHYNAMRVLKDRFKSAPRYRKPDHDYYEDMLVEVCRVAMRPALGKFARALETHLGWTRLETTGLLDHAKIKRHH